MSEYVARKAPKLQRDWWGCRVRLRRDVTTGAVIIPAGRVGTVSNVGGGIININFDACQCCKVSPRLRLKVVEARDDFEFVEPRAIIPA